MQRFKILYSFLLKVYQVDRSTNDTTFALFTSTSTSLDSAEQCWLGHPIQQKDGIYIKHIVGGGHFFKIMETNSGLYKVYTAQRLLQNIVVYRLAGAMNKGKII